MNKTNDAKPKTPAKSKPKKQEVSAKQLLENPAAVERLAEVLEPLVEIAASDDAGTLQAVRVSKHFSGPLPPPDILRNYEEVIPGVADRIVSGWESETAHRRNMQKGGQRIAATIAIGSIVAGVICAALGQPWTGGIIVGASMFGIGLTGALHFFISRP